MKHSFIFFIVFVVVLAIPIVPFLLFEETLEEKANEWFAEANRTEHAVLIFGLLATDVFLPVPSSVVGTWAGNSLGLFLGTSVVWAGLTFGAVVGFLLAKFFGNSLVHRFAKSETLEHLEQANERWGLSMIILFRAVPVLAEATVLFFGISEVSSTKIFVSFIFTSRFRFK